MLRSLLACACALAVSCAPADAAPKKKAAARTGTITGVVSFTGKAPAPVAIPKTDPFCSKQKIGDERVVVVDGKLRDVHVGLPAGAVKVDATSSQVVHVDQVGCMYRPRVVGVIAGQKIQIKNSDMTFHNVRGSHGKHHAFNHGQPQKFPAITESAGKAGETLTLRCDVHPWMRAYAVVTDHPFFDVTGDDGAFTIADVPAGTYELEAWHPELGAQKAKVTVAAGKTATVKFTFK